jgi:hypothetical protein
MTKLEKLNRLTNRGTAYELIAVSPNMTKVLAGYTPRRSKEGIVRMLQKNGAAWTKKVREITIEFIKMGKGPTAKLGDLTIFFTGRTQREAILEGELPWFEDELKDQ